MAFGIDTNKMIDRAMEKLGPIIERSLGTFNSAVDRLDQSVDAMATEQQTTNKLLRQMIVELRKK